jgi:hypothetical protein
MHAQGFLALPCSSLTRIEEGGKEYVGRRVPSNRECNGSLSPDGDGEGLEARSR